MYLVMVEVECVVREGLVGRGMFVLEDVCAGCIVQEYNRELVSGSESTHRLEEEGVAGILTSITSACMGLRRYWMQASHRTRKSTPIIRSFRTPARSRSTWLPPIPTLCSLSLFATFTVKRKSR